MYIQMIMAGCTGWSTGNDCLHIKKGVSYFCKVFQLSTITSKKLYQETLYETSKVCLWVLCKQQRPRSEFADAQSDRGLHYPLPESLATTECMNGEQRPWRYFACAGLSECIFYACSKFLFAWCGSYIALMKNIKRSCFWIYVDCKVPSQQYW